MNEATLICTPGGAYKAVNLETGVAQLYTKLAFEEYDSLVRFHEGYEDFIEQPDFEKIIATKEGRILNLTVFAKQPAVQIGNVKQEFVSTSYLFNPNHDLGLPDLYLPDLDVIEIESDKQIDKAVKEILDLYQRHGWIADFLPKKINARINITPNPRGFAALQAENNTIEIADPHVFRQIAREEIGYSLDRLCF